MGSPTAVMPTPCCGMPPRPNAIISWCPRWWNNAMCMACEEMQLFYAYLDQVEEAKRKAQPWQCEVTLIPEGGESEAAAPAAVAKPAKDAKSGASKSGFSCDETE